MADKYIERKTIIEKLNEIGGCDASDDFSKDGTRLLMQRLKLLCKYLSLMMTTMMINQF